MSREVLDEIIENIEIGEMESFPDILESIFEYGFADENDLCKLFDIESSDLDDLVSTSDHLTESLHRTYSRSLIKYLKKARKSYDTLYYSKR